LRSRTQTRVLPPLVAALAFVLALAALLATSGPAAGFPSHRIHDRTLAAAGSGAITVGNANDDSRIDVAVADEGTGSILVFLQGSGGLEASPSATFASPEVRKLAFADVDLDGGDDLVALRTDSIVVHFNDQGRFGARAASLAVEGAIDFVVARLNGDSFLDIAVLGPDAATVRFHKGFGAAAPWANEPDLTLNEVPGFQGIAVADLLNDGRPDLVLVRPDRLQVYWYDPGALGLRLQPQLVPLAGLGGVVSAAFADIDGDGFLDVTVAERHPSEPLGQVVVYLHRYGTFTVSTTLTGRLTSRVELGDVNDDGSIDIVVPEFDASIAVYLQRLVGGYGPDPAFRLALDVVGTRAGIAIGPFTGRPFSDVIARVPGSLLVYEQDDLAPTLLRAIPSDIVFNVGASGTGLLDLRNYFGDDHGRLAFSIAYQERPTALRASIAADGYHVEFTAASGWYGVALFRVAATDSATDRTPVLSNTFAVAVNARPTFTSAPPTEIRSDQVFHYQATVQDPFPLAEARTFSLIDGPVGMGIDTVTGLVEWRPGATDAGMHPVRLRVVDAHGGAAEQTFSIRVVAVPPSPPIGTYVAAIVGAVLTALGFGALASENIKYGLLALFLPLYSKIKREHVLDHFVRGQIYGYVLANPGEHYNAIKMALGLTNGSLAHHLKTLEREEFIKSKRFGLYRRFYPINMRVPEDGYFQPNSIQRTVIDLIRHRPGITQKEIAGTLGLTPPTVNYHVTILNERRLIRVERAGRKTHCFCSDSG